MRPCHDGGNDDDMTTTRPGPTPSGLSWRLARLTAPLARTFAGRRFFPLWAIVHHIGRRSGRALAIPVTVGATAESFVITLPWGAGTNWVRNVLAADGCTISWKGVDHQVVRPEIIDLAAAMPNFGPIARRVLARANPVFLRLHRR
jgi:hypothetical protein